VVSEVRGSFMGGLPCCPSAGGGGAGWSLVPALGGLQPWPVVSRHRAGQDGYSPAGGKRFSPAIRFGPMASFRFRASRAGADSRPARCGVVVGGRASQPRPRVHGPLLVRHPLGMSMPWASIAVGNRPDQTRAPEYDLRLQEGRPRKVLLLGGTHGHAARRTWP